MKNIIRAFVLVLVVTGVAASSQTPSASTSSKVTIARTSFLPVPTCDPSDANACGMGHGR